MAKADTHLMKKNGVPIMQALSEPAFSEFCRAHHILPTQKTKVRDFMAQLMDWLNAQANKKSLTRRQQVRALEKAGTHVKKLRELLTGADGEMKTRALRKAGLSIGEMIDPTWIARTKLRGASSMTSLLADPSIHESTDEKRLFVHQAQLDIVQSNAGAIVGHLLVNIESGITTALASAIRTPGKGGRTAKIERTYAIINLAELFSQLGHKPTGAIGSKFSAFVEEYFELTGWQSQIKGLDDAIPDGIDRWKKLPKNRQVSP